MHIRLEYEDGERIEEQAGLEIYSLLPLFDSLPDLKLLKYVDRHLDIMFNGVQMPDFISDCERVAAAQLSPAVADYVGRLIQLAERCRGEPHSFIRFVSD
jgi:hypothetical protein